MGMIKASAYTDHGHEGGEVQAGRQHRLAGSTQAAVI